MENPDEVIATLVNAVHQQHQALDMLIARLCIADPTFRPSQSGDIWKAVEYGHNALQEALHWQRTR